MRAPLLILIAACGCSNASTPPLRYTDAGIRVLEPSLFDCTAAAPPERTSTTPIACGLDPTCRTRQVTAHRGAGGALGRLAPEDTLAAYRAAIALGVDYVETDPRPTKDGVIVNMHDDEVDRTTNGTGKVDELTFAEVRALEIKSSHLEGDFSCERVPTLEEILQTCKGKVIVLIDANKTNRVEDLVQAVQTTGAIDWAIFDTSDVGKIDRALELEPRLHTQIRIESVQQMREQLEHFAAHPPVIIEADDSPALTETSTTAHALGGRLMVNVFFQDFAAGVDGNVAIYGEMFERGADIVQTDRPELVLHHLGRW